MTKTGPLGEMGTAEGAATTESEPYLSSVVSMLCMPSLCVAVQGCSYGKCSSDIFFLDKLTFCVFLWKNLSKDFR